MDNETLAAAVKQAVKKALPAATAGDEGAALVVDNQGAWVKGQPIDASVSVSGTKLVIITGGDE